MDKLQRTILKIAEEEGLKVLGVTRGSKHRFIVVTNNLGWTLSHPLHSGNRLKEIDIRNQRADFRRFAKGQVQHLHGVLKEKQDAPMVHDKRGL